MNEAAAVPPGINPFQVYPVRGLSELRDVESLTVQTFEVQQVHGAVVSFLSTFLNEPPISLLLAARGDFGTGKTHLMLYASAVLSAELNKLRESDKSASGVLGEPVAVMAVSSEERIEDWYKNELAPAMINVASPRELVRELLTRTACEVAAADPDPEIARLAEEFRKSRKALYEQFRNPGEFDVSEVDARFGAAIRTACPRTSRSFRRIIEALRWEETAELAEDWLAGQDLSEADAARIGVHSNEDLAGRAANAICAIASLCRVLGRPFALFVDEFEHLTRHDKRGDSKRNITWTKRLVESLARRGAMVFISGHWEAWAQQGDFLDRFVGGRPIQLVRLSAEDVMKVVQVRAGAWPGLTPASAQAVVDETSGNIRQVMTVLYDLWDRRSNSAEMITRLAVQLAAQRRLQPGSDMAILPAIERAVYANGGILSRDEIFGEAETEVDGAVRIGNELRLLVKVVHARDELALISGGENFAKLVHEIRAKDPAVRGLCVTLGAVVSKHILTLDAAFPETDLINGEEPDIIERLPEIVAHALSPPVPAAVSSPASLQALERTRVAIVGRADAQIQRSENVFGDDSRSEAVRESSIADSEDLAIQREKARATVLDELIINDRHLRFASVLLHRPDILVIGGFGLILLAVAAWLPEFLRYNVMHNAPSSISLLPGWQLIIGGLGLFATLFLVAATLFTIRLAMDVAEFRSFRARFINRCFAAGAPLADLTEAGEMLDGAFLSYGPRQGRAWAMKHFRSGPSIISIGATAPPSTEVALS